MPTVVPYDLSSEQIQQYLRVLRIEDITRRLRNNDVLPPVRDRSPSPEGDVVTTAEVRYRSKLETERHKLVEEATREDSTYRPPHDYRRPGKVSEKIYIPVSEFPEVNFMGLIIGPRGHSLKKLESETGVKVSIRGKGSLKEGKGAKHGQPQPGEDEDLHCLVAGESEDSVNRAVARINKIIEDACSIPETENEMKRNQLRELALLNGTLRDDEGIICANCGAPGHRRFECPERANITNTLICRICGGVGHVANDCLQRNNPEALQAAKERSDRVDSEYERLMKELDGGVTSTGQPNAMNYSHPGTGAAPWLQQSAPLPPQPTANDSAPWVQPTTGGAAPWAVPTDMNSGAVPPMDGAAPWANPNVAGAMPWQAQQQPQMPWMQQQGYSYPPPPPPQ